MAEKKIGAATFKVEPLLATEALRLQMRLIKALGPGLSRLPIIFAGAGDKDAKAKEASNQAAVSALSEIISQLEPNDGTTLIKDVAEIAMIRRPSGEYSPVDVDGDFTGKLNELIQLIVWVLREQFAEVFSGALAIGRQNPAVGA